ncbi:hypothetical protein EMCRGX_G014965 [Ephydatia muelleri]
MLALIWAIQYFKPYLWGRPFKVRTDHSALKWLKIFKDPHGQVARWLEILSEYDFTVEHRPGLKHGNADSLSRLPCRQCGASQDQVENLYSLEAALAQATESDLALWLPILTPTDQETLQNKDPALARVMVWVESNSFPKSFPKDGGYWLQTLWAQQKYLVLRNGVLYRRWEDIPGKGLNKCLQFVLPQDLVPTVLEQLHNAPSGSHLGVSKTVEKTDDLHVARPDEELPVEEENGDIDGDIPAEASETDDEINSNIDREIPAETSESDDEIETEEPPVDQGDHLQGAEDVTHDEDVQMPPANLRRSTRHSQRPDRWGQNIYDL